MFAYEGTEILVQRDKEVQMAVHEFGEEPFGLYQWTAI